MLPKAAPWAWCYWYLFILIVISCRFADSILAQGFNNIGSGLKTRWEALGVLEAAVDKEASIAHQEGWFHAPSQRSPKPRLANYRLTILFNT